jgi:hypothetical protein
MVRTLPVQPLILLDKTTREKIIAKQQAEIE